MHRRGILIDLLQHGPALSGRIGRRLVRVQGHVRVYVNQSRQPVIFHQVHHFRLRRNSLRVCSHFAHAIAIHNHNRVRPYLSFSIPQLPKLHRFHSWLGFLRGLVITPRDRVPCTPSSRRRVLAERTARQPDSTCQPTYQPQHRIRSHRHHPHITSSPCRISPRHLALSRHDTPVPDPVGGFSSPSSTSHFRLCAILGHATLPIKAHPQPHTARTIKRLQPT